ncbi:MAG: DUF1345 domain-containing protein, partial [Comamonadaceae bacterium]
MPTDKPFHLKQLAFAQHVPLWRALRVRPRLAGAIGFGLLVDLALQFLAPLGTSARALVAWDSGALLYLGLCWWEMRGVDDARTIQSRAVAQDDGRTTILLLVVLAALAVLLAVGTQLAQAKALKDQGEQAWHLALAGVTVVTSWFFTQV